jgi:hypothetical protein
MSETAGLDWEAPAWWVEADRDSWKQLAHITRERAERAEAENARLRAALEFYGDPDTYDAIGPLGTVRGTAWKLKDDMGKRARDALRMNGKEQR